MAGHPYNEGWRFGIAYFFLALVMGIHYLACKHFGIEATMDNGYADSKALAKTSSTASKADMAEA